MLNKIILLFLSLFSFYYSPAQSDWQQIHIDVVYLASEDLEGRETGKDGEKLAAAYIAKRFHDIGLSPKGDNGWYHSFAFSSNPHEKTLKDVKGTNVVGFLNRKAKQTIVIGAHYDHLGHGANGSLAPNDHSVHNGADDNASGVSSLLWLAERLSKVKKLKTNVLFIAFSGEEFGLHGSKAFVDRPTIPLESISAMFNMDMVGRLNAERTILVSGVGTSKEWGAFLDNAKPSDIKMNRSESGIGPSDHTSFYLKNIPVLHFFTGQHGDYHKPSDDSPIVNYPGILDISKLIYNTIIQVSDKQKLTFQKTKDENKEQSASFKVTLGIMPDYVYSGKGTRA
ncbi:MAG: M28 family peptidase, partial [Saprospiraceae bacterium]